MFTTLVTLLLIMSNQALCASCSVASGMGNNAKQGYCFPQHISCKLSEIKSAIYDDNSATIIHIIKQNPSVIDREGTELLHFAIQTHSVKATHILLNKGVDPTSHDANNRTVLENIASHPFTKENPQRVWAITQITRRLLKELRTKNPQLLNTSNKLGIQPIHIAAANSNYAALLLFLAAGASVNARTTIGDTPLHIAAHQMYKDGHYAHEKTLSLLLAAGADTKAVSSDRQTPLDCAIKAKNKTAQAALQKHDDLAKLAKELVEGLKKAVCK